jgi:putative ABC transport system permease protein
MRRVTLKGLLASKSRFILTALAIVLGTAFLAATGVLTDSIRAGAEDIFGETARNGDVEVRGAPAFSGDTSADAAREPLSATVLERVRQVDGVEDAAGIVRGFAQLVDEAGDKIGTLTTHTEGGSAEGIGTVSPFELRTGHVPRGAGEVVIDAATARNHHLSIGDRVTVLFAGPARQFELVGTVGMGRLDGVNGTTYALFDLATAQEVLDRQGLIDDILVSAAPGVSDTELARRISAALGDDAVVVTSNERAGERAATAARNLAMVNRSLSAFALIALAVAGFIIVNTFTIVVAQRTRELALLRALGASQRQVRRSVLAEAAITGVIASTAGTAAGVELAVGLRALVEGFGLELPGSGVIVSVHSLLVPLVVGVVLTIAAAYVPARRAGKLLPLAAMREVTETARASRKRYITGAILAVLGIAGGMLGVPLLIVAAALLAPLIVPELAGILGWPGVALGALPGKLGHQNAVRNPRRTASTASALMIGLALVVGVTVVAASALHSFSGALDDAVKADFAVYSHSTDLSPELAARLSQRSELATVSEMRSGEFELVGIPGVQSLTAIDGDTIGETYELGYSDGALDALADGGVLVSETRANQHHWRVGDTLEMRFARTGVQHIRIDGTYADDALEDQGFLLSLRDFEANYTVQRDVRVLVKAAPGVTPAHARAVIEEVTAAFPNARVDDRAGYVAEIKGALDIVLALVAILLGLAVIIAVLGIVNTLALSIVERTRELGLLRAVGMSRRQLRAMIRWESLNIALIGGVLGVVVGMQIGITLSNSLGNVITEVTFPWLRIALLLVFAVCAGVAAAIVPARRAARLDVLAAISH